jgi:spore germination protein
MRRRRLCPVPSRRRSRLSWRRLGQAVAAALAVVAVELLGGVAPRVLSGISDLRPPAALAVARPAGPARRAGTASLVPSLPLPLVLAYVDGSDGLLDLPRELSGRVLNGLVPDWYTMEADGSVSGSPDPVLVDAARRRHLRLLALVQNNADPAALAAMLTAASARRRALSRLTALARQDGYDGLNLDFEGLPPALGGPYLSFVRSLHRRLNAERRLLTLSVPPETATAGAGTWYAAYPYAALGRAADLMMIMAYDQHWAGGAPGSVASAPWVDGVLRYAVSQVAPDRLVLGLPAYGYDWSVGTGQPALPLTYDQAVALARAHGLTPRGAFTYTADGITHRVFYESAQTFDIQAHLAAVYGLAGIVIWRLGIEDPAIWPALRQG